MKILSKIMFVVLLVAGFGALAGQGGSGGSVGGRVERFLNYSNVNHLKQNITDHAFLENAGKWRKDVFGTLNTLKTSETKKNLRKSIEVLYDLELEVSKKIAGAAGPVEGLYQSYLNQVILLKNALYSALDVLDDLEKTSPETFPDAVEEPLSH